MKRYDFLKRLVEKNRDELIIAGVAPTNHELFSIKDLPTSFYMRHSLGMASSIGLGLALAQPNKKVIVLEGDGGMLMNLGHWRLFQRNILKIASFLSWITVAMKTLDASPPQQQIKPNSMLLPGEPVSRKHTGGKVWVTSKQTFPRF